MKYARIVYTYDMGTTLNVNTTDQSGVNADRSKAVLLLWIFVLLFVFCVCLLYCLVCS